MCATTPPSTHSLTGAFFNRRRNEERASDVGAMSTPARKRLMRDFKRLQKDPPAGISGTPTESNIMVRAPAREPRRAESSSDLFAPRSPKRRRVTPPSRFRRVSSPRASDVPPPRSTHETQLWQAVIFGPEDTPWEGGTFKLNLTFSEDYPNKAPVVKFESKMFHPNIYNDGGICLDILQNQWSPIYDVSAILTSIQSLLCDPNPNSPANSEAARLYSECKREYNKKVQEVVERSWTEV